MSKKIDLDKMLGHADQAFEPQRDGIHHVLGNDVRALVERVKMLESENRRLGGASTARPCVDCGSIVRPCHTVKGRCYICQGKHMDKLESVLEDYRKAALESTKDDEAISNMLKEASHEELQAFLVSKFELLQGK